MIPYDSLAAGDSIFDELLHSMSEALDIREIFPRVSEIVAPVLQHDRLTMTFHDVEGQVVIQAASNDDFPTTGVFTVTADGLLALNRPYYIVEDFARTPLPILEPPTLNDRIVAAGYRSLLRVHVKARHERVGLAFWSKRPCNYTVADVPFAHRVADHVALAVSHQQLAEASRQVADAQARAERLEARVRSLADELDAKVGHARVIGPSPEWQAVLKRATQVAATDTTVLLSGESGTGKEVVARYIYRTSPRKEGPFVAINCATLPEQLLESELFGHERGAFTGAQHAKPGQIELAAGGVLFLDEVTEMSSSAQAKFLRVLHEREFLHLGGRRVLKSDVRVIAATNRDLRKAVERGDFREDLYYRLQVFNIRLPPLRERRADILPLSDVFLDDIGRSFARPPAGLTRDATTALLQYGWPGNVRELRNALERAAILCEGGLVTAEHLSLAPDARGSAPPAADISDLKTLERNAIADMLRRVGGNKSEAARRLGLSRTQLYVRLQRHRLQSVSDGES
jgi:transcriptional regulator with PAS, ATPase and Fis domain